MKHCFSRRRGLQPPTCPRTTLPSVSPVRGSSRTFTCPTGAHRAPRKDRSSHVIACERMPLTAMSLASMFRGLVVAAHHVYVGTDRFQVIWSYAKRVCAEVINGQLRRNAPIEHPVGKAMSPSLVEAGISIGSVATHRRPQPIPAAVPNVHHRKKSRNRGHVSALNLGRINDSIAVHILVVDATKRTGLHSSSASGDGTQCRLSGHGRSLSCVAPGAVHAVPRPSVVMEV